jgi:hypothetical protein
LNPSPDLVSSLVKIAARIFEARPRDILGDSRFSEDVAARRSVISDLHARGFAYAAIGRALGRDHTTIRAAEIRVRQLRRVDSPDLVLLDIATAEMRRRHPHAVRDRLRVRGETHPIVWTGKLGTDGAKIWRLDVRA